MFDKSRGFIPFNNIIMEKVEQTDKPLFDNLRKLINLIDSFRDVGLHEHIELPRIAVLGNSPLMQALSPAASPHSSKTSSASISCPEDPVSSPVGHSSSAWCT